MKKSIWIVFVLFLASCGQQPTSDDQNETAARAEDGGQSNVKDADSQPDVVDIALNSPDHSTLVSALKAAGYLDELSNAGPFTVFAPTNAAFDKLPAGTLDNLLKTENKDNLRNILEYHVYVGVLSEKLIQDGMKLNQVNLDNVVLRKKDGKLTANDANVLGSARGTNGIVYVIDAVLLPPQK